jgi:hypothetical protein
MFGLDTKSLIVGAVLGAVVVPKVLGAVAARKGK